MPALLRWGGREGPPQPGRAHPSLPGSPRAPPPFPWGMVDRLAQHTRTALGSAQKSCRRTCAWPPPGQREGRLEREAGWRDSERGGGVFLFPGYALTFGTVYSWAPTLAH